MKTLFKICATGLLAAWLSQVNADPVWIDVRTVEEVALDHIDGDENIPIAELTAASLAAKYGKDAELMLYCRSGNRAGQAEALLETAGFTNVTNVGSVEDARVLRGLKKSAQDSSPAQ